MDSNKKAANIVTIGGRRYVKNNMNGNTEGNAKLKLGEALKQLGRNVRKSKINYCVLNKGEDMDIYESSDSQMIFAKNRTPVGVIISGKKSKFDSNDIKNMAGGQSSMQDGSVGKEQKISGDGENN
ncbi:hypothetical protein CWI42_042070 [Ordospora colligata]|uniref:Uncharacterized protein n=1 Tax=Ordospora colligata OC4 TaxID=1354746 RepID=A0A0B2UKW3_9MICR|nr:uncharacterized protein M896_042080 [Ordospora colligata OC4]KHN70008.1 hypothetical protein M896_042080 [Ordospora colligata OC4]TBU16178.1 hypothetical protein CWI41_042070 [Ordospora colligata]TBU16391.1 hypothetical protein CWI40_042070 [Ordospora colligata]TBU19095.1 hypothetical protein CWI42_042070 [Ordospora colligata]